MYIYIYVYTKHVRSLSIVKERRRLREFCFFFIETIGVRVYRGVLSTQIKSILDDDDVLRYKRYCKQETFLIVIVKHESNEFVIIFNIIATCS